MENKNNRIEIFKEFQKTYCPKCNGYAFCGGETIWCVEFTKYFKNLENK